MADPHSTFSIYLLTNRVNGKYYVGQTTKTPTERWSAHKCEAKTRSKVSHGYLHHAIRKYGADAFLVETLATAPTINDLNRLEVLWILVLDAMNPRIGYNRYPGGRNYVVSLEARAKQRGRLVSPETRAKMSAALKGRVPTAETLAKISASLKGRKPSPQNRAALLLANTGRKQTPEAWAKINAASLAYKTGRPRSAETRAKMRAAAIGHVVSPETAAKISAANKGHVRGIGRRVSPETRARMRAAALRRGMFAKTAT